MKKVVFSLTMVFLMLLTTLTVMADNNVTVVVDGEAVEFADQKPVIVDGCALVPVRATFETMGFNVSWDEELKQTALTKLDNVIVLTINSNSFTINSVSKELESPVQLIGGRTMLSLPAVLENVGYQMSWDDETATVTIVSADAEVPAENGIGVHETAKIVQSPENSPKIPEELNVNTSADREGYPWFDDLGEWDVKDIEAFALEYGAYEIKFAPISHELGNITETFFVVTTSEGISYSLGSYFDVDSIYRTGFNSWWLPLGYGESSPARYFVFADGPGEVTITSTSYVFRDWDEIAAIAGLHEDSADTLALNPSFPELPFKFPDGLNGHNDWVREPYVSSLVLIF